MQDSNLFQPNHLDLIHQSPLSHSLYIGNYDSAIDLPTLTLLNIKTVLTIAKDLPIDYSTSKTIISRHKLYPVIDSPEYNISKHFGDTYSLIQNGLESGGVLVHCAAGVSRSASVVLAYLMRRNQWGFLTALKYVKGKRRCVKPNRGFESQLRIYEHHLKNMSATSMRVERNEQKTLVGRRLQQVKSSLCWRESPAIKSPSHKPSQVGLGQSRFRVNKPKPIRC